jgi:hypothetical protein
LESFVSSGKKKNTILPITYYDCFSFFFKIDLTKKNFRLIVYGAIMKKVFIIYILFFAFHNISYSQDCEECGKRTVIQFEDAITSPPVPVNSPDSISNFINLLKIPSVIANYFKDSDPTINCVNFLSAAFQQNINESNYKVYANFPNTVPDNTSSTDYYLKVGMFGENGDYIAPVYLKVGKTREIIKGQISLLFHDGFDPVSIGEQAAAPIAPLYTAIMEYEKGKRDGGAPYAIKPKVEMKAAKTTLDFSEVSSVTITITDCDDTPLKNRNMTLSVDEGGTLDKYSVTTDDQGQDVVKFTAGTEPKIAVIQGDFSYTEPTEKEKTADVEPLAISIKKPDDCWYAQAKITYQNYYNTSTTAPLVGNEKGTSNDNQTVFFAAWVKEIKLPLANTFQSDPNFVQLKFYARSDEVSNGTTWFWNEAGGYIDNSSGTVHADDQKGTIPKLNLNIGRTSYSFTLSDIDGTQSGSYTNTADTWDKINGHKTTTNISYPSPTTTMKGHVQGYNKDTSETYVEDFPETGTHNIDNIKQTFYWKDKVLKLNYQNNYTSKTFKELEGITENDSWNSDTYAKVYMYYNTPLTDVHEGKIATIPGAFRLEQNYPNPFNPVTLIQYSLPKAGKVRGEVFDVLGRSMKTWEVDHNAGTFAFEFNGRDFPSGIYFYSITAKPYDNTPEFKSIKKMVLIK